MIAERIRVEYAHPPIPPRAFDYTATFDGYEPGDPIGSGPTAYDAILDLLAEAEDAPIKDWTT